MFKVSLTFRIFLEWLLTVLVLGLLVWSRLWHSQLNPMPIFQIGTSQTSPLSLATVFGRYCEADASRAYPSQQATQKYYLLLAGHLADVERDYSRDGTVAREWGCSLEGRPFSRSVSG
jgi:hypothetical protein